MPVKARTDRAAFVEAKKRGSDDERSGIATICPYNYVKIEGMVYKRDSGSMFDDMEDFKADNKYNIRPIFSEEYGEIVAAVEELDQEECAVCWSDRNGS